MVVCKCVCHVTVCCAVVLCVVLSFSANTPADTNTNTNTMPMPMLHHITPHLALEMDSMDYAECAPTPLWEGCTRHCERGIICQKQNTHHGPLI